MGTSRKCGAMEDEDPPLIGSSGQRPALRHTLNARISNGINDLTSNRGKCSKNKVKAVFCSCGARQEEFWTGERDRRTRHLAGCVTSRRIPLCRLRSLPPPFQSCAESQYIFTFVFKSLASVSGIHGTILDKHRPCAGDALVSRARPAPSKRRSRTPSW